MVWAVATAGGEGQTVAQQTVATLRALESNLAAAGASKHSIVDATVYLSDIATKAEMDGVWNEWIPPGAWPCRACVGVDLAPGDLVEIKVTAMPE
jgi:enamine deaminase RidA (YjgF/YER057c/UK114 family)